MNPQTRPQGARWTWQFAVVVGLLIGFAALVAAVACLYRQMFESAAIAGLAALLLAYVALRKKAPAAASIQINKET